MMVRFAASQITLPRLVKKKCDRGVVRDNCGRSPYMTRSRFHKEDV